MSSPHFDIHPQTEDEKTQDVPDAVKEDLFRKAMQSRWQDVARSYSENKKVRKTQITWAGDTLLHVAASSGDEKNVMLLVDCLKKAENEQRIRKILAIQNDTGDTALHIAAALGMVDVCLAMARLYPEMVVEIREGWKETPLFTAVRHGQKKAFFALRYVVGETAGARGEGGDTILHNAIFAEHFDLALEIIHCYPDLVNAMNEKGKSPLHVLANKPSAFKSGTRFSPLESVIYHCIYVDPLKVEYPSYEKKFKNEGIDYEKILHDGNYKLPDNYQACYNIFNIFNIFTLLKLVFTNIAPWTSGEDEKSKHNTDVENKISAPWTSGEDDKSEHIRDVENQTSAPWTSGEDDKSKHIADVEIQMPPPLTNDDDDDRPRHSIDVVIEISDAVRSMGTTDKRDPENGVKEQQNGPQNRPGYPKNYYSSFDFIKFVLEFLPFIIGIGLWRVPTIKKMKQMNTHACQIMEELLHQHKSWHYAKDGRKPGMAQGDQKPPALTPPDVNDGSRQPNFQQIQDEIKKLVKCCCKQVEDDSKQKPDGVTPILVAAKSGVIEMVEKILKDMPVAALDRDEDYKNIALIAAENRQFLVYELMMRRASMQELVFGAVDKYGNSALHLAARLCPNNPWPIPGAAIQMQCESMWYKYVKKSTGSQFFMQHNKKGETAQEIFTNTHNNLVKEAGKWLNDISQWSSVVAVFVATVAFASATTVPGGVDQNSGFPIFEGKRAFQVFALSSLIALFFSITSLIAFLSILTSHLQERDFAMKLPVKLILGLTALFLSVVANLVSFCAGHFLVIEQKLKNAAYPIYAALGLLVSLFAMVQFPLYIDFLKATFAEVPQRTQKLHPS